MSETYADAPTSYWVYLGPFRTRAAAQQRRSEVGTAAGEMPWLVENGPEDFDLSLGVFKSAEAADAHAEDLVRRGVSDVRAGPRYRSSAVSKILIRDVPEDVIAALQRLRSEYPTTELRTSECAMK